MNRIFQLFFIIPKLGIHNFFYVFWYRFSLKSGLRKKKFPLDENHHGEFFTPVKTRNNNISSFKKEIIKTADNILKGEFTFYHYHNFHYSPTPNWFYDPFSEKELDQLVQTKHWTQINEFDLNTGDIKNLWEISRFDWLTDLGRAYAVSGEVKYLKQINLLLNDWSNKNPVNLGVNWKCGQETSIRVMKLFYTSMILDQTREISENLYQWIFAHLKRINGNIRYALAQDNNHGTSEAAGLYIGACWLLNQKTNKTALDKKQLLSFKKRGRKLLEERIKKLILKEGTFGQKSVNYHRVVIDTMSFVLYGIQEFNEPKFEKDITTKLNKLGIWLLQMVSNKKGEVPVLGANDGAMFETLHSNNYRDYRPSLLLYFALLNKVRLWNNPDLEEVLLWRKIDISKLEQYNFQLETQIFDNEFIQLVWNDIIVRVIATQDNFRPANDVLHVDIWYKGENIITSNGSFSYNSDDSSYFQSISSNNSLQFGDYEPMPRLSRFLNGSWVQTHCSEITENSNKISWRGSYRDYRGNEHKRKVIINKSKNIIEIRDDYQSKIENEIKTLRFHSSSGFQNSFKLKCFDENQILLKPSFEKGWQSLYYLEKKKITGIEWKSSKQQGTFQTIIKFIL